jgi:ketosteroid isomerase-like protein
VNALLQRLDAGDIDSVGELFAEEIDWYIPGGDHLPWAGHRTRRAEVPEYFHHLESVFDPAQNDVAQEKVLIDGDDAVVFATFRRTFAEIGRGFANPAAMHLEVRRDPTPRSRGCAASATPGRCRARGT